MTVITCTKCGEDIKPGQGRKPTNEGVKHDYCVLHDSLFDQYYFSITNPPADPYGVSFWRVDGGTEFPVVMKSNEFLVCSSSPGFSGSEGIAPSGDFFTTVAYAVHDMMSFTGGLPSFREKNQVEESFEKVMNIFYEDTKMPKHEQEIGKILVSQIAPQSSPYIIPEIKPIRDFADECTAFSLPDVPTSLTGGV